MAANPGESQPRKPIFLLTVVTLLAACCGAASIAREAPSFEPKVGDIITFDATHPAGFETDTTMTAVGPRGKSCVLDMGSIRKWGGSLVLEQRGEAPDRLYRAHWSGPRTSEDRRTDCGKDADLVLSRTAVTGLIGAAGGFGEDPTSGLRVR
jgi:hypothetical protein